MSASLSTRAQMPTMPHHQLREHYLEAPNESHTAVHNPGTTIADMRAGACAHNRGSTTSAASSLRVQVLMPPPPQLRFHCLHTCKRLVKRGPPASPNRRTLPAYNSGSATRDASTVPVREPTMPPPQLRDHCLHPTGVPRTALKRGLQHPSTNSLAASSADGVRCAYNGGSAVSAASSLRGTAQTTTPRPVRSHCLHARRPLKRQPTAHICKPLRIRNDT